MESTTKLWKVGKRNEVDLGVGEYGEYGEYRNPIVE